MLLLWSLLPVNWPKTSVFTGQSSELGSTHPQKSKQRADKCVNRDNLWPLHIVVQERGSESFCEIGQHFSSRASGCRLPWLLSSLCLPKPWNVLCVPPWQEQQWGASHKACFQLLSKCHKESRNFVENSERLSSLNDTLTWRDLRE